MTVRFQENAPADLLEVLMYLEEAADHIAHGREVDLGELVWAALYLVQGCIQPQAIGADEYLAGVRAGRAIKSAQRH